MNHNFDPNAASARKRIRLSSLHNIETYVHAQTGARLNLSYKTRPFIDENGDKHAQPFFVFWAPPNQKSISQYSIFNNRSDAQAAFEEMRILNNPPGTHQFKQDYQEDRVIEFNSAVSKGSGKYSLPQMQQLTKQVAREFNTAATEIDYEVPDKDDPFLGLAYTELNEILMKTREVSIVLHEMAHIIDTKLCGNTNGVDHSPSFMRAYISLLSRYMHFPELELEAIAKKHGIDVAPLEELPELYELMEKLNNIDPPRATETLIAS